MVDTIMGLGILHETFFLDFSLFVCVCLCLLRCVCSITLLLVLDWKFSTGG